MRQKLITLDPTSFETASSMPNFSQWVRNQLRHYRHPLAEKEELNWYKEQSEQMQTLLEEIAEGKKEWISPHGWLRCGEEE